MVRMSNDHQSENSCESYYSGMVNCTAACASLVKQSYFCVNFPASSMCRGDVRQMGRKDRMCDAADARKVNDRDWWIVDVEWCGEMNCVEIVERCVDVSWAEEVWLYDHLSQVHWCRHRSRHSFIYQVTWCLLLRCLWLLLKQLLSFWLNDRRSKWHWCRREGGVL